jgi:hypothetical protein
MKKLIIPLLIFLVPIYSSSQSRRTPEIRSCLASEFAFASLENANPSKGWDDNFETGKRIGYIIAEFYQKAIWSMDNPETEGREAVLFALESSQNRIKYMDKNALKREVERCRVSFK